MPESKALHTRWALVLVWLVPAFWAVNYIVARKAPGVIGPHILAIGRWAVAALILLLISGAELWRNRQELARVWWQYLILGSLGMLICGAWVYQGARSTDAMNIALIYSFAPVLIALGASLWLGEAFRLRQAFGMVLAFIGLFHVIVKGHWNALSEVKFVAGDGWILVATLAWAGYALLQKKWPSALGATARLAAICLGGVISLLPFSIWELTQPGLTLWNVQALLLVLIAALVPGAGAYWIYGWTQKILGANRVAVTLYLVPLYVSVVAWTVLGEMPGWHHLVGAALILPGVYLVTRIKPPPQVRS